ncbi:MAG: LURP-one-related family protein [Promethearchaeota archaeon]
MSLRKTREFLLQEKWMTVRDKIKVLSVDRQELGWFTAKIISTSPQYRLYSAENPDEILLTIKEKIISIRSTYSFFKGERDTENLIGRLKQKMVSIKPKYWFEDPDKKKLFTMKGSFWKLKYQVFLEDKPVAEISKKIWKVKDTYGVKMNPDLDDDSAMLVLGIVVMLHHEKEEEKKRGKGSKGIAGKVIKFGR